jgi:acetyltransferase-like isoleucine patch superfamily enzyme
MIWTFTSFSILILLLKFIVGPATPGYYPLNSHYYLHKLWLRQLIISSFHHSLGFITSYDAFIIIILRWLGAYIADDVKIADFRQILHFPSNLLDIECGVTTFGGVKLNPFEMTREGLCYIDKIQLGSGTNLGNGCTIMPGTRLSSMTLVGSLTLFTRKTVRDNFYGIFLGIPAREMPFVIPENLPVANVLSSSKSMSIHPFLLTCSSFFISKCILITLYSLLPVFVASSIHLILICAIYQYLNPKKTRAQFTYSEVTTQTQQFLRRFKIDFSTFVGPYLSGTQYLVFLYRAFGAQIGCDVILSDFSCVTDPHLTTIGDHVRLNIGAAIQVRYFLSHVIQFILSFLFYVQCHTFEQRLLKLAPVIVNHSSVLMSNTLVLSGSVLHGHNRILPCTLVMKNEQLPPNSKWSGVPAQQII